ncbi:ribosomal protein L19 [Theileria orientalis strain Shintoku]|uniref:50S ribosomal protein L19, chloroplastic n=1 Tax=Theileria orientalis strain Shintoku TaxID=869250 RepID=J4DAR6_THEOR|nr:ribosomal protein L19 [Theileria orientalis strain Shintoku]BAM42150.1 ribosomal protein L19 [Theileria orientalis strain Shintoku]|eukprot:XP_009692451.1 ribosomal protein L19 [Theileria orientalis strain Shintoku]
MGYIGSLCKNCINIVKYNRLAKTNIKNSTHHTNGLRLYSNIANYSCLSPTLHLEGRFLGFYKNNLYNYDQRSLIRTRAIVSNFDHSHFVVTNPKTAENWPPENDHGSPISRRSCKKLMFELNQLEMERMEKMRKFNMPELNLGDLVEVKYELSRTQQTFAMFTGYCVDIRNRGLNSSFSLKNAFDGVGVTQLFPSYSPRILNVKIIKSVNRATKIDSKPITRDYRYKFHYNVRHRFAKKRGVHKPGIRSFEIRLKNRITRLKQSYYRMRLEAGLPPYIWGGPYNINTRKRTRQAIYSSHLH